MTLDIDLNKNGINNDKDYDDLEVNKNFENDKKLTTITKIEII